MEEFELHLNQSESIPSVMASEEPRSNRTAVKMELCELKAINGYIPVIPLLLKWAWQKAPKVSLCEVFPALDAPRGIFQ